jgi:anti-sigma B factor antagonist
MKIQTEIIKTILVVTCVDARLDAPAAEPFFMTIQALIKKGHMHIAIDLSNVNFVDSTGLGAMVRCLKELGGQGQLVLFGVNETFLSLLELTKMDSIFTRAKGINEAIELLLFNKKRFANRPPGAFTIKGLSSLKMEDGEKIQEVASGERRRHKRIRNKQITDKEIIVTCTNVRNGKRTSAIVLNISPSGLLLLSPTKFLIGKEYIVEGTVGKIFKFKERAVIRQDLEGQYGLEFLEPSSETTQFLHQLTGAVIMGKGNAIH